MKGEVPFTMKDIDRLSRQVPVLCKVAPSVPDVHLEDVHRAGGIMAHPRRTRSRRPDQSRPADGSQRVAGGRAGRWDIKRTKSESVRNFYMAAPGGVPTQVAFSQDSASRSSTPTAPRAASATPSMPISKDGGLAVLFGNIARGRLHREDRRRRREHFEILRARRASSKARTQRSTPFWATRSRPATSW